MFPFTVKYKKKFEKANEIESDYIAYNESSNLVKNDSVNNIDTSYEALKKSHNLGIDFGKSNAKSKSMSSAFSNIKKVIFKEKDATDATADIIIDTVKSYGYGYVVGNGSMMLSSGIKSVNKVVLNNTSNKLITEASKNISRNLTKGMTPVLIVSSSIEYGKSILKYINNEITADELVNEVGEKSCNIAGSLAGGKAGAFIGTIAIPIPGVGAVVGEVIGSLVGYIVTNQLCNAVKSLMNLNSIDSEEYARLRTMYNELYERRKFERIQMEKKYKEFHKKRRSKLKASFNDIEKAAIDGDYDIVNSSIESILEEFDIKIRFKTQKEFDSFMEDKNSTLVL